MEKYDGYSFRLNLTPTDGDTSYSSLKRRANSYIKGASNLFSYLSTFSQGATGHIQIHNAIDPYWKFNPLFYFKIQIQEPSTRSIFKGVDKVSVILILEYSDAFWEVEALDILSSFEDFSTDAGRQKFYRLVDSIAKFIHLNSI